MSNGSVVLTVDYELFGNGSGTLCSCISEPAERMLAICDHYNAPLTIFADVTELMVLEAMGKDTQGVERVKNQLISAVERGHDVQLHVHPQWDGAASSNGVLDYSKWRIGDLDRNTIFSLLAEGKAWLEGLLKPVKPDYNCSAFRAGGWCIQPSKYVVSALVELGIVVDSTVAPGIAEKTARQWFDFRSSPSLPYWYTSDDVVEVGNSELLEIPIATGKVNRLRHVRAISQSKRANNGLAPGCNGSYSLPGDKAGGLWKKARKIAALGNVMLDYSTMPSDILIDVSEQWLSSHVGHGYSHIPLVAIGHTKNFTDFSASSLDSYCKWVVSSGLNFSTYSGLKDKLL